MRFGRTQSPNRVDTPDPKRLRLCRHRLRRLRRPRRRQHLGRAEPSVRSVVDPPGLVDLDQLEVDLCFIRTSSLGVSNVGPHPPRGYEQCRDLGDEDLFHFE